MNMRFNLAEAEHRIALTRDAASRRATMLERWAALSIEQSQSWEYRAVAAAPLFAGCARVADLGCGHMLLENHLPAGTQYLPVDVVPRDERTVVCDFNVDTAESLPWADAVAMLDLLEYVYDCQSLIDSLPPSVGTAVVSYCVADRLADGEERMANGWVTDHTTADIEAMFQASGWTRVSRTSLDGMQVLWHFVRPHPRASRLLFVGGTGRSGTSATQELIASAPGSVPVIDYEARFLTWKHGLLDLYELWSRNPPADELDAALARFGEFLNGDDRNVGAFSASEAVRVFGKPAVDAAFAGFRRTLHRASSAGDRAGIFRAAATGLMERLWGARGRGTIVEKTPDNALNLVRLVELFPEASFIISLRHPIKTLRSFMKQTWHHDPADATARRLTQEYGEIASQIDQCADLRDRILVYDIDRLDEVQPLLGTWLANRLGRKVELPEEQVFAGAYRNIVSRQRKDGGVALTSAQGLIDPMLEAELRIAFGRLRGQMARLA